MGVSGRDFDDTASEASSAVSGMSAYAGSTAAGSTTTASSRRATSTVGGKKPSKRKNKKVRHEATSDWQLCHVGVEFYCDAGKSLRPALSTAVQWCGQ